MLSACLTAITFEVMGRSRELSIFASRVGAALHLVVVLIFASCAYTVGQLAVRESANEWKLYVFGDSYVDNGNHAPGEPNVYSWDWPYGNTWPGYPTGRSSNGHVFSDRYATYLKVDPPITFRSLNLSEEVFKDNGMEVAYANKTGINFAYAGSGAFSVENPLAYNASIQIKNLWTTINLGIVSTQDLANSTALIVINGNDYSNFLTLHPDMEGILDFIPLVAQQIANDVKELSDLGFNNIVVNNLGANGCLPKFTYSNNFSECNKEFNQLIKWHNSLLIQHISSLQEQLPNTSFQILNFYAAIEELVTGDIFQDPLEPCCKGLTSETHCGSMNEDNEPQFSLCSNSNQYLFWDDLHLTDVGYEVFIDTLFSSNHNTF